MRRPVTCACCWEQPTYVVSVIGDTKGFLPVCDGHLKKTVVCCAGIGSTLVTAIRTGTKE